MAVIGEVHFVPSGPGAAAAVPSVLAAGRPAAAAAAETFGAYVVGSGTAPIAPEPPGSTHALWVLRFPDADAFDVAFVASALAVVRDAVRRSTAGLLAADDGSWDTCVRR